MTKRAALLSAMLLAGVVVAVVGATAALRFVGGGAFGPGGEPLTQAEVRRSLAQHPSPAASPASSTAPVTPHPAGTSAPHPPARGSFTSSGGTVNAACLSGQVRLTSWIPAQGYQTDRYSPGPGASAWVVFKSSGSELTITATCARGNPSFSTAPDNRGGGAGDRHGGGSGRGGSGSSGGGSSSSSGGS